MKFLEHIGRCVDRLLLRLAQLGMLHDRRALHDLAPVFFDGAVAIERVDDAARLLFIITHRDDANREAAFVEEFLQTRAHRRELVVRERVENLEEQLIRGAIAP